MKISKKRLRHIVETLELYGADTLYNTIKEEWYPEVFREKMDGWYRDTREEFSKVLVFFEDDKPLYGFNASGTYRHVGTITMGEEHRKFMVKADHSFVLGSLIVEAKRRGFKDGVYVSAKVFGPLWYEGPVRSNGFLYKEHYNQLSMGHYAIFREGQWAEVIETISKEEAEKQLGKKIV